MIHHRSTWFLGGLLALLTPSTTAAASASGPAAVVFWASPAIAVQPASPVAATEPATTAITVDRASPAVAQVSDKAETHATPPARTAPKAGFAWNARSVEHLYNRAGFGARASEIEAGVKLGQAALVDKLVTQRADVEPFFIEDIQIPDKKDLKDLPKEEQQKAQQQYRERDRRQLIEYTGWWFDRMASGEDPLREKMVLFWHGLFTTSAEDVKRGVEVLRQNQFVRDGAMGSYADLLSGMARDPAMLVYLNNNVNRKGLPNENLAREIMELFSLGVGNYTEKDIKEAARALTGRGVSREGKYEFHSRLHDDGEKTVLGVTGKLDGDDLVKILLKQDACANYVAKRLLTWFEGVEPKPERTREYAVFLRAQGYQIQPFLKKLFMDPAFYRDEVVGARVQSPVEFLVGMSRRLGIRAPALILGSGAALLGQRLFAPPSVKGWDEGEAWITTASLMQRGNLSGMMLGVVKLDDVFNANDIEERGPTMRTDEHPSGEEDGSMRGEDGKDAQKNGEKKDDRSDADKGGDQGGDKNDRRSDTDKKDARSEADKKEGGDKKDGDKKEMDGARKPNASRPFSKPGNGAKKGGAGYAYQALRRLEGSGWTPAINFTARMEKCGALTDAQIVDRMLDDLLAIQAPADTKQKMCAFLSGERAQLNVKDGHLFDIGGEGERLLRRLAHLILSLPEAQLG